MQCPFDSVSNQRVNHNIYLLFFPGERCTWSLLILACCLSWPGSSSTERCVEVTGMADCMPFYGIGDLREILQAVKGRDAKTVEHCRPLKVSNYLEVREAFWNTLFQLAILTFLNSFFLGIFHPPLKMLLTYVWISFHNLRTVFHSITVNGYWNIQASKMTDNHHKVSHVTLMKQNQDPNLHLGFSWFIPKSS